MHQDMLKTNQLQSNLAEKSLGVLVSTRLNINHQCVLAAKKTNNILQYVRKSVASKAERGDSSPLLSTGEAIPAVQYPFLGF